MAAGVNYNNVWAARGYPVDQIADPAEARRARGLPHRWFGCLRHRLRRRRGRHRHRRSATTSSSIPGCGTTTTRGSSAGKRPDDRADRADLGLRHQLRLLRPVRPRPGPPGPAEGRRTCPGQRPPRPHLVGTTAYRMLHGWAGQHRAARATSCWSGAAPAAWEPRPASWSEGRRRQGGRGRLRRRTWRVRNEVRRDRLHRPAQVRPLGHPARWSTTRPARRRGPPAPAPSASDLWEIAGGRAGPRDRLRAPRRRPPSRRSIFVCQPGGMVVICAGTTGFDAMVDLRYHWTRQKRLQGSHGTNDAQAYAYNDLVRAGKIDPVVGRVLPIRRNPALPTQRWAAAKRSSATRSTSSARTTPLRGATEAPARRRLATSSSGGCLYVLRQASRGLLGS